jgi:glutamate formiminotransferase
VLECVLNVSEGRGASAIAAMTAAAGADLLDVHSDPHHHRTVLTLVGEDAPRRVATEAITRLDLSTHAGAHPRLGVVDVVPFVPLAGAAMSDAVRARDRFGAWLAGEHDVPVFLYGDERSLPEIRRDAFGPLSPDVGPATPHPTAGATCVGARPALIAYNVWLTGIDLAGARAIASAVRRPGLRALGLQVGDGVQVSMNLVALLDVGPAVAYDLVAEHLTRATSIERAELVGLLPRSALDAIDPDRWAQLDVDVERTIEARLAARARFQAPGS